MLSEDQIVKRGNLFQLFLIYLANKHLQSRLFPGDESFLQGIVSRFLRFCSILASCGILISKLDAFLVDGDAASTSGL